MLCKTAAQLASFIVTQEVSNSLVQQLYLFVLLKFPLARYPENQCNNIVQHVSDCSIRVVDTL